jgi:predicted transposase/invertase (TIGR01784 family)
MPELANAPLGLSILQLIRQTETQAPLTSRELVARTKAEIGDEALRVDLIELIETVILCKLPRLSREEIETMLQIHDIRESRVYQEAMEEGEKKGIEKGVAIAIAKMVAEKKSAAEIAALLGLNVELVRRAMANTDNN